MSEEQADRVAEFEQKLQVAGKAYKNYILKPAAVAIVLFLVLSFVIMIAAIGFFFTLFGLK